MWVIHLFANRLDAPLGSGQFGDVFKGELTTKEGKLEVAVKTLKKAPGDEERIKFLQEATIMAQFKHPNVILMYGLVLNSEPVRN